MANIRIHRQSCELGLLPPVCICCGEQASGLVRHSFHRSPTWQILFLPVILLLTVANGLVSRIRHRPFQHPLAGEPIEFPVPICDADRSRLKWHHHFLWAIVAVLAIAAAMLLLIVISMVVGNRQNMQSQLALMEAVLFAACGMAALLLAVSMFLSLMTARVTDYTPSYIDMTAVAPEFVVAVSKTSSSPNAGYGRVMGAPLTRGMGGTAPNVTHVAALGGMTAALVAVCCLVSYVARTSTLVTFKSGAAQFQAKAKQWHERVLADVQKRMADGEDSEQPGDSVDAKPADGEGTANSDAAPQFPVADVEGNPFEDAAEILGAPKPEPPPPARAEEFRVFGRERFPPHTRELRDTSLLQTGMEVWASAGLTWYRSTVVRVENHKMARIRFPVSTKLPERPLPAMSIRLPADEDAARLQ